ncbi:transposase [Mucilaginibacter sp.]|uniref:transposase n=1 Tax=Mucilaginibacter sp. TaxID=1882438 RepID=UPI00374CBAAB
MMNKGQFRVPKRTQKDYTLAFKLQVVEEVESGELSQHAVCRKYGIQARSTILSWLRKHGRLNWYQNTAMAKKPTPNRKIAELEKKIKRLEAEKYILNTVIDVADETLNTDIRKKYLSLLLSESNKQQQAPQNDNQLEP